MNDIAGHYCGQTQPHEAHTWQTPQMYGAITFTSTYQCAGAKVTSINLSTADQCDCGGFWEDGHQGDCAIFRQGKPVAPVDPTERVIDGNDRETTLLEAAMFNAHGDLADDADDYTIGHTLAQAALAALARTEVRYTMRGTYAPDVAQNIRMAAEYLKRQARGAS